MREKSKDTHFKVLKKVLNKIFVVIALIVALVLAINIYFLIQQAMGETLPNIFGVGQAIVTSGSMEPEIETGSLIIVKEQDEYNIDDVVTYDLNGMLITHRIIEIDGTTVVTQGDANNTEDEPFDISIIKGEVLFSISKLGSVILWFRTTTGLSVIIFIGMFSVLLSIMLNIFEKKTKKDKKDDDKEKIKIE